MSEKERTDLERITEKINGLGEGVAGAALSYAQGLAEGREIGRREGYIDAMKEKAAEAEGEAEENEEKEKTA